MENEEDKTEKLKRAVIKEEFVALTGNVIQALILNQFLYWTDRLRDLNKFIKEENERAINEGKLENIFENESFKHGWIYKSAKELNEELMLSIHSNTLNRHLKSLVEKGFLEQRHNPKYKWDRTWQYRVNIPKIKLELKKLGYVLQGYKFIEEIKESENANLQNEKSIHQNSEWMHQNNELKQQNTKSKHQNSKSIHQRSETIPEITTETTSEIISETTSKRGSNAFTKKEKSLSNTTNENPNSFTPKNNSPSYKSPNNLSQENIKKQRILFEKFWTQYPRKVNKVGALAEWLKINPDEALFNEIMKGLENYIKYEWPNMELEYIIYPSTFLAQRRWEDKPGVQYPKPKKVWTTTEEEKDGLYDSHIKPLVSGILKDV